MPDVKWPIAIISDVHANLEALTAVIDDIRSQNIGTILNLGDTVGYGPDPEACIDLVDASCSARLCGNHDYAVLFDAEGFNLVARKSITFHRRVLRPDPENPDQDPEAPRRWEWLGGLEPMYEGIGFEAMHGSPRQPITEYVLPSDPETDPAKLADIFSAMSHPVAFVGHTHFPGILEEGNDTFLMASSLNPEYRFDPSKRVIVNVGSVGQPRDRNPKSCYAVYDGKNVIYRRVAYDVEKTVSKILANPEIHPASGLRLREGR
ncbi:MAG: metallophosphatase family protein [Planctomycetota bacterium]|jgi:predicted phosphodiesterase|nr:metallophosphatase family protein [Planctomycetota bacterium]